MKALTTVSRFSAESPSVVTTSLPSTRFMAEIQDLTALLSSRTVQHPQTPSGEHPSLGEMIFSVLRR